MAEQRVITRDENKNNIGNYAATVVEDYDSGVEDDEKISSRDEYYISKQKPVLPKSRRRSFWNLFGFGGSRKSYYLPEETLDNDDKDPCYVCKTEMRSNDSPNKYLDEEILTDNVSNSSDLGESITSNPASTLSSSGSPDLKIIPGLVGMHNLGNSCSFNSVLQCIAHINILSEYFASNAYFDDFLHGGIARSKKSNTNKYENQNACPSVGLTLAQMIKCLWNEEFYSLDLMQDFKSVIGYHNKQYQGSEQQDAQEFLLWLIDVVHEESTKISKPKTKFKGIKTKKNQSDEERAVQAFASHTHYYKSYIQSLFLSQYKSTITCSNCQKHSSTFDPFTCVSLSIPQPQRKAVFVTVIFADNNKAPLKIAFDIKRTFLISALEELIRKKAKLKHIIVLELQRHGTPKILRKDDPIGVLSNSEFSICAVEVDDQVFDVANTTKNCEEPNNVNCSDSNIVLLVSNVEVWGNEQRRFGVPHSFTVSSLLSFKQIQVLIRKSMASNVRETLNQSIKENKVKLGLRVVHPSEVDRKDFLQHDVNSPLKAALALRAMVCDTATNVQYLYLAAEWEPIKVGWYMGKFGMIMPNEDASCKQVRDSFAKPYEVDLDDCLKLQTQEEKLDGTWKCPSCGFTQKEMTKKLSLWALPDILVLHLKRFDQMRNEKISTLVNFPLSDLNMSQHVATTKADRMKNKNLYKESVRLNYLPPPQDETECVYDLKAVCNHVGFQLNSGHYTASCLNSVNGSWYTYDDRLVKPVSKENVATTGAYLLFYQRRKLTSRIPDKICLSISKASQQPLGHWSYKMNAPITNDKILRNIRREDDSEY